MPSLLDIAPPEIAGKEIEIRGITLMVRGVSAIDWAQLYTRFPALREVVAGRVDDSGTGVDRVQMMMAQCALIATGTGHPGNQDIERAAMTNISMDEQRMLMEEIIRLSNPGDVFSPLLDGGPPPNHGSGPSTGEPDTNSPKQLRH